jgi:hypothetical protein
MIYDVHYEVTSMNEEEKTNFVHLFRTQLYDKSGTDLTIKQYTVQQSVNPTANCPHSVSTTSWCHPQLNELDGGQY